MTDTDSENLNKNILSNAHASDKILNTKLQFGQRENKNISTEAKGKMHDGQYRNKICEDPKNCTEDIFVDDFKNKEQQEEDVPESFFDDFMSEDFIEGLNVVDTWEGDDTIRTTFTTKNSIGKEGVNDKTVLKLAKLPTGDKGDKARSSKNKPKREKQKDKRARERSSKLKRSSSRNREHARSKRSRSSPSRNQRIIDSNSRRDPSKTQRDIQRDKDKCEKDKNTKILHEKLKVVETGLVPPGMEMEVEVQNSNKVNKLEEGEIIDKEPSSDKHRRSKSLINRKNRPLRTEPTRYSPNMKSAGRRNYSPDFRKEHRRLRSRSKSIKHLGSLSQSIKRIRSRSRSIKRMRSRSRSIKRMRSRSRSIKRRHSPRVRNRSIERRRRSSPRPRSRSFDFLDKYKDRSPLRKTSPLLKRNQELFKEIDVLRAKLYPIQGTSNLLSPIPRNIEHELMNKHINMPNMDMVQHSLSNLGPYAPVPPPTQNFVPLQPVPPPQQPLIELDQQFFIGQQPMMESINSYSAPMSQPHMLHNPGMQPVGLQDVQQSFPQNWIMEQSQPQQTDYFNPINQFNMEPNEYQPPMCPPLSQPMTASVGPPMGQHSGLPLGQHLGPSPLSQHLGPPLGQHPGPHLSQHPGQPLAPPSGAFQFLGNITNMIPQEVVPLSSQRRIDRTPPIPVADMGREEELFAKMFADNKITLSDYLSISAKTTDHSSPVDVQNKIKVISHCQEALSELTGNDKNKGKFLLRKSQKSINRSLNSEGLSPFKKVPVVKFQFTTYVKQTEEKPQLATYLNRLMYKLRKDVSFQEVASAQPSTTPTLKTESGKESHQRATARTVNISVQTESPSTADFGCQVSFEEVSSPVKGILKKQSLAKLTPAQLLAQAENESSPPPAPRWTSFPQPQINRRTDIYKDFDDMDRRNFNSNMEWSIPSRNNASNFFNRPADELGDFFHGKPY